MTKVRTRTLDVGGKRANIRLDPLIWQAIDLIAERQGVKWATWAHEALASNPNADNRHAVLRAAAMHALLEHSILDERAELVRQPTVPLLALTATLDDEQLRDEQQAGYIDAEPLDMGGFSITPGSDMHGRACIWITNAIRDMHHMVIALPFTPAEIAERLMRDQA